MRRLTQVNHDARNFGRELRQANFLNGIEIACDLLFGSLQVRSGKIEHDAVGIVQTKNVIGELAAAHYIHFGLLAILSQTHLLDGIDIRSRRLGFGSLGRDGLHRKLAACVVTGAAATGGAETSALPLAETNSDSS